MLGGLLFDGKTLEACLLRSSRCLSPTPLLSLEKGAEAIHEKRETRLLLRRSYFSPTKLLNPDFRAPFSLLLSMLDRGASRSEVSRHHQEALNLDAHSSIPPSSAANGIATEETSYTRSTPTLLFQKRLSVLNAKPENVEREAEIVAQSGRLGAVTISTNMAGRGTDIILGGNAEFMARLKLREVLMPRIVSPGEGSFVSVKKALPTKNWKVKESLFPCKLSDKSAKLSEEAVQLAVKTWGQRSLPELEAEERLSYSCEKGPVEDEVILKLRSAFLEIAKEYKTYTEEERKQVVSAGGLHVIGTERHESRRIDNQLRGRSGRQGDPGSTRFFLSLEDNIFRIFGGDRIQGLMKAFRVEDLPIESQMLTKALDEAQRKVENYFFDIRKNLFEFDEVLNSQRDRVYAERRRALQSDNLESLLIEYAELTMDDILEANIGPDVPKESWDLEKLIAKVQQYCFLLNDLSPELLANNCSDYNELRAYLQNRGKEAYLQKKDSVEKEAPGLMKEAERFFVLSNIDRLWKEHLQALRFVQQAVGLRGYAQRDPLIEYKLEGYNLFLEMMAQIRRNVIYSVYQFRPVLVKDQEQQRDKPGKSGKEKNSKKLDPVKSSSANILEA